MAVTAQRLSAWAGSRGLVGQLGGDEFALTVRITPAHHRLRLEQLAAALAEPVDIGDGLVDVAVFVGAATPDRVGTTDLLQLQRAADAAMYAGKHTGQAIWAAILPAASTRLAARPTRTPTGSRPRCAATGPVSCSASNKPTCALRPRAVASVGRVESVETVPQQASTRKRSLHITGGVGDRWIARHELPPVPPRDYGSSSHCCRSQPHGRPASPPGVHAD
ncbi:diguanylate cyclase domain-containing protein [Streptomyces spiralis]